MRDATRIPPHVIQKRSDDSHIAGDSHGIPRIVIGRPIGVEQLLLLDPG